MLAFNLGVFFRNLKGEEVVFSAISPQCQIHFTGGVTELEEKSGLTRQLSVTLSKGGLSLLMEFEESVDDEPEDTEVSVEMSLDGEEDETALLHTTFRFGDISLKPVSEIDDPPSPALSSPPPENEPEPA